MSNRLEFNDAGAGMTETAIKHSVDTATLLDRLGRRSIVFVGLMGAGKDGYRSQGRVRSFPSIHR